MPGTGSGTSHSAPKYHLIFFVFVNYNLGHTCRRMSKARCAPTAEKLKVRKNLEANIVIAPTPQCHNSHYNIINATHATNKKCNNYNLVERTSLFGLSPAANMDGDGNL